MTDKRILKEYICKPKNEFVYKIPIKSEKEFKIDQYDNLSITLAYLDKTYSSNVWRSCQDNVHREKTKYITTDFKTCALSIIQTLYSSSYLNNSKLDTCSHLLDLKNYSYNDLEHRLELEYDKKNFFNLHDLLLYSPKFIDGYEKILFILYQLLKFTRHLNSINLNCTELKLSDIYIDQKYWIRLKLPIESIFNLYKSVPESNDSKISSKPVDNYYLTNNLEIIYNSYKHLNQHDLANLTKSWCNNRITNFDYLLILNCIAGRKLNCPYNHPIFPWISDFTSLNTNLRDLSVSKFRLNKGDAHLDMTYQASSNTSTGGYHLTEFLSEITYFVYKSRQTDKEILCKHVRRTWVPNEYPGSINRLYLWTPEECIPEFYCDPNIFKSIHEDLPDLKLPEWCNGSNHEFIRTHRLLLESDLVSRKLNNWIDLIFGYKLSGEAAIEAKNVCLPLIDNHQNMKTYGIVQLFTVPHPNRSIDKTYHSDKPPIIKNKFRNRIDLPEEFMNKTRVQSVSSIENDSIKKKVGSKVDLNEVNNSLISLPDDYNPFESLDQVEALLKFVNKSYHCLPDVGLIIEKYSTISFEDYARKDLKCLACILCEIILFNKLKCLPQQNSIENRYGFICKAILQEPHIINGPFMPFILSVLKPFTDWSQDKAHNANNKKTKSSQSYLFDNILKYQSETCNLDTLLNPYLTQIPFKAFMDNLYKFNEITFKLDYLIENFNNLSQFYLNKQINLIIQQTGFLNLKENQNINFYITEEHSKSETNSLNKQDSDQMSHIKLELVYEQKFYLALLYLPKLMYDMSDPKKNHLAQSICVGNESYELIIDYLINLFENPNTCINSFLFLFSKLSKFLSRNELIKKFLRILLLILNVVDLNETIGLDLSSNDDKSKFCKLFDYTFINELRIIFGLEVFLSQICPFLVEAISGFKDFEYEPEFKSTDESKKIKKASLNRMQAVDQMSPIFDMESSNQTEPTEDSFNNSIDQSDDSFNQSQTKHDNISRTAFNTFTKLIPTLGPVLTCKYCCTDLFKMLAICYMNNKCLAQIETSENPLNSLKPIEGDRFSFLILESLKTVSNLYGEQIIVLQYLPNVSNTVSACVSRLSMRLEASLLAGIVLVNYFLNYLDIKLLMDELNYILNQILIPVISLYSNEKIKFPNGSLMRQVISYKTLDIILLISLRIGPEQTRTEMERVLKYFFNGFSQVRSSVMNPTIPIIKPSRLNSIEAKLESKSNLTRGALKARASIVSFNHQRLNNTINQSKDNLLLNTSPMNTSDFLSDEMNSFDEYLKFSYDQNTQEIVGSSLKTSFLTNKRLALSTSNKYRTQSFGLLSLNDENDNTVQNSPTDNSPIENLHLNDELLNTFTIELAHLAYLSISRLSSGVYIDSILSNADLIHRMCLIDEQAIKKQGILSNNKINKKNQDTQNQISKSITGININNSFNKLTSSAMQSSSYGSSFSENVSITGNQIQINDDTINNNVSNEFIYLSNKFNLKFNEKELKDSKLLLDTSRHLSDNWLAYWQNEIRTNNTGNLFDFKHINLLTLTGHTSSVRCLLSLDNESSFISASKDKTVKLWSLKMHGGNKKNQQSCQWTYSQHKKPVSSLLFIDSLRVCVSCDSSVHVWNPFIGRKLFQFDSNLITCMANLPGPSSSFVVATADNNVKFIDLRAKSHAYELKPCYASSGSIKSISTSDNLLLVGFSTGLMCIIDMRTGWIQESCKTLDNEILQLKFISNDKFISSYNDGSIALCSIRDKVQIQNIIKVYNEPVPFFNVNQNQLITSTASNKIGIHSNIDKPNQISFFLNKLQPEIFKGVISSQTYLPLNRLLLLGSDNGDIKLMC